MPTIITSRRKPFETIMGDNLMIASAWGYSEAQALKELRQLLATYIGLAGPQLRYQGADSTRHVTPPVVSLFQR